MLKNIISKLSLRSRFRQQLRKESAYDKYTRLNLTDSRAETEEMGIDTDCVVKKRGAEAVGVAEDEVETVDQDVVRERESLRQPMNNPLVAPQKRLPSTLFDLKNVLQVGKKS